MYFWIGSVRASEQPVNAARVQPPRQALVSLKERSLGAEFEEAAFL